MTRGRIAISVGLPLAIGLAVGVGLFHGVNFLERLFVDLRFVAAASLASGAGSSQDIAVILMDPGTRLRERHPDLIAKLNGAGASLIVFDAMFLEEEPSLDGRLAQAIRDAGNVVAAEKPPEPGSAGLPTTPLLRDALLAVGDPSFTAYGGVPRALSLGGTPEPLAMVAARLYLARQSRAGPQRLPGTGRLWINFGLPLGWFRTFSYADVIDAGPERLADRAATPLSVFVDKVVLIGIDDPVSSSDRFALPNSRSPLPGVFGQAYALETILRDHPLSRVPWWTDASVALAFLGAMAAMSLVPRRALGTIAQAILVLAAFVLTTALQLSRDVWVSFAPVLAGGVLLIGADQAVTRVTLASRLRRVTGFDPGLVDAFRAEQARSAGPVTREATVLVADVRDYTRFVASTDAGAVATVMQEFATAMDGCIAAAGGYINKYVGDEIVAIFGFPLAAERSAARALEGGTAMLEELGRLQASWHARGSAGLSRIGIGIDCGRVSFLEIGGRTKSQFDVIGDCVNGAARIQAASKQLRHDLLVSEEVWRALASDARFRGLLRPLGEVAIRGQGKRRLFAVASPGAG